jgi:hypothetical protein
LLSAGADLIDPIRHHPNRISIQKSGDKNSCPVSSLNPSCSLRRRTPVCAIGRFSFYKDGHRMPMNAPRPSKQTFAQFMASLPREEIDRVNQLNRKKAVEQHKAFSEAFKAGSCSFCGSTLTSFDTAKPCRHWLLKPDGVRKEHIETSSHAAELERPRKLCALGRQRGSLRQEHQRSCGRRHGQAC